MKSNREQTYFGVMGNNYWLLKKIWKYTPGYIIWMIIEGIVWGIHHSVSILYTKLLFDALERHTSFDRIAQVIISYFVYLLIFYIFHHWYWDVYNPTTQEKLHIAMHSELFQQAVTIDLDKYDDPKFYNDFIWTMDQSCNHAISLIKDTGKLINRIVASFTLIGVLFSVDTMLAVIILGLAVLRIVLTLYMNQEKLEYKRQLNPLKRKDEYIKRVFRLPDYAKELRITNVRKPLFKEYSANVVKEKKIINDYGKKFAILMSMIYAISIVGENVLVILVLYKVLVMHELGLSGFSVAINGAWKMSWLLGDMIERIMKYHEHGIFIDKIITFLECKPIIKDGAMEAQPFESLVLKNLKFSYGTNMVDRKYVLNDINMEICKGERIAIVGYNGAGKTTLTKLLMRLYDPDEGEIIYNGRSVKDYKINSLRKHISAVFQDYRIFACSLAENVAGGAFENDDEKSIICSLKKSTFSDKLDFLPCGIHTQLTREFDNTGVVLSGGEQQKVAIARAFFKNADIIILDEPSSALDPDAEYVLNQAISEYADNKTVIFISHRLSTTKNVDRIYMFDRGKVIECGTHDELMSADGKYAYMFRLQAEKYQ